MIKCTSGMGVISFGIIVKLELFSAQGCIHTAEQGDHPDTTWGEIVWADGHRTWEEMEVSLETCFEVISESR